MVVVGVMATGRFAHVRVKATVRAGLATLTLTTTLTLTLTLTLILTQTDRHSQ